MNFYQRYLQGETITVYDELDKLDYNSLSKEQKKDIDKVLIETFERVAFNLNIIYKELLNINYLFKTEYQFNFQKPIHKPLKNTEQLLKQLNFAVQPFGFVPLSLQYFYKIVGGVNFLWDFETDENFMWEIADPIQIYSLDSLVEEVTGEYWQEDIQEYVNDKNFGYAFLDLAPDDLHKDNVSGGSPYAIQITKRQKVDSAFLNEPNNTSFINYLRICFEHCGFMGLEKFNGNHKYDEFVKKVKPQLKLI